MKLVLSIFILVIFIIPVAARDIDKDFHESFKVEKGMRLHLKHGDGDVTLTPWNKDIIEVDVIYRAKVQSFGIGKKHDFDVEFRESGDVIHVIGHEASSIKIGVHNINIYEYIYKIKAPSYIELEFEGDDGNVYIQGWESEISCKLDDGEIEMKNIISKSTDITIEDGDIDIETLEGDLYINGDDGAIILVNCKTPKCKIYNKDGNIRIKKSEGDFEIKVDDARVELTEVRARFLEVRSNDGRIEAELLEVENIDLEIKTDDGDIRLAIEEGMSAEVTVDTDGGYIRVNLPSIEKSREEENWFSGEMNDGEGRISLRTNDGDVTINEYR